MKQVLSDPRDPLALWGRRGLLARLVLPVQQDLQVLKAPRALQDPWVQRAPSAPKVQ